MKQYRLDKAKTLETYGVVKFQREPQDPTRPEFNPVSVSSMKKLRVLLLPPGWDASPSHDTQHKATESIATPSWMEC